MNSSFKLKDLPPSPSSKTNWPWIKEGPLFPDSINWPRLTIITPSFNQADFIEESLRSVILQMYPNLEFIIIDGGSNDGSIEIIKKYEPWITYWHSKKDKGHTDAINQGFRMATGDLVAWLNTDDIYLPGTFARVIPLFNNPKIRLVYGKAFFTNEDNQIIGRYPSKPLPIGINKMKYWLDWPVAQPTTFFRRDVITEFGILDEAYHYSIDYEWFIRLSQHFHFTFIDEDFAFYRIHNRSKTGDWTKSRYLFHQECLRANLKYAPYYQLSNLPLWLAWGYYQLKKSLKLILKSVSRVNTRS